MALFLLTQIFLIITHTPLVEQLLSLLLFGDVEDLRGSESVKSPVELDQIMVRSSAYILSCLFQVY